MAQKDDQSASTHAPQGASPVPDPSPTPHPKAAPPGNKAC